MLENILFEDKRTELLKDLEIPHATYYDEETFSGPSLYFHIKSLSLAKKQDCIGFADSVYATLASWGMHRMRPNGSKMNDYEIFYRSLENVWPLIIKLQTKTPNNFTETDWGLLKEIFCSLKVMASKTSLVGNSKVMAHALPDLIPPVDRQYTLKFIYGNGDIRNDVEKEWTTLRNITEHFFHKFLVEETFILKVREWMNDSDIYKWDTSQLKIVDNLIIGFMKYKTLRNKANI